MEVGSRAGRLAKKGVNGGCWVADSLGLVVVVGLGGGGDFFFGRGLVLRAGALPFGARSSGLSEVLDPSEVVVSRLVKLESELSKERSGAIAVVCWALAARVARSAMSGSA